MSDLENVDVLLGSYSRNNDENDQGNSDVDLDSESIRLQRNSTLVGEDFRSLLYTNSREKSEMNIKTTRMTSDEITNQVTWSWMGSKLVWIPKYRMQLVRQLRESTPFYSKYAWYTGENSFRVMDQSFSEATRLQGSPEPEIPWKLRIIALIRVLLWKIHDKLLGRFQ